MTIGLFPYISDIMSLLFLCAITLYSVAQKLTSRSTMYPLLRGEARATNRPYFLAGQAQYLVKWVCTKTKEQ